MAIVTRRSVLQGSVGLVAAGALARPYIANAQAKSMSLWVPQGFVQDEDLVLRKLVTDYEKKSGNKVELSIIPFAPLRQKLVSAITSGVVPDAVMITPNEALPLYAWQDKWEDVGDVVETQKANYSKTALATAEAYNNVTKKRAYYGVPVRGACIPCHYWKSLIEKADMSFDDLPKTWDAHFDYFKKVQDNLRKKGMRKVYGLGFQVTANGVDPANTFNAFMHGYGGAGIVTPDGKLNLDERIRTAAIKAAEYLGGAYRDGYVPPSAINWNDADDNNAFHAKLMVMDVDGTLSTEVAHKAKHPEWYFEEMRTNGLNYPTTNDGKPITCITGITPICVPKGAKNVAVAKEFLKDFIQPDNLAEFIELGLGRWLPVMPKLADRPFWHNPKDPHLKGYVQQGLLGPTQPDYYVYNPAMSEVYNKHIYSAAMIGIAKEGLKGPEVIDKAFQQIKEIFDKYPIQA
jgi:multiple sugar transport system substrate-binding protein